MAITDERTFGGQTLVAPLRRVRPAPRFTQRWPAGAGWDGSPNPTP